MIRRFVGIGCFLFCLSGLSSVESRLLASEVHECDVLVYGGTPAGIMAAISAAENGQSTTLIVPHQHVGGIMSSGLCATDMNSHSRIGGRARKFFQRVYEYYSNPAVWRVETRDEYFERSAKRVFSGRNEPSRMQWTFEPRVAEGIFVSMLRESGVTVRLGERLDLKRTVRKEGNLLRELVTESGDSYGSKIFIDATYDGDLMARAGVSYIVGREANDTYGEQFNGIRSRRYAELNAGPAGPIRIDSFLVPGNRASGPLPFISAQPPGEEGKADKRVQAYCYRYTLTDDPANRLPIEKPADYDPLWFEMLGRTCAANPEITLRSLMSMAPLPNRKVDVNMSNMPGVNYGWPEGDYAVRAGLMRMHKAFALGKLYFLVNDSRVPSAVREELSRYGLPRDEFVDNDHFPYEMYVREARRMISDYVMTEHDALRTGTRHAPDGVAIGSYMVDSHQVGYFIDAHGELYVDGSLGEKPRAYSISYRSIVPREAECANLLVPVCISSSHPAYGSIRMEPVFMVMGHSAGTAAALAIKHGCSLQDLPYSVLRAQLESEGQFFLDGSNP